MKFHLLLLTTVSRTNIFSRRQTTLALRSSAIHGWKNLEERDFGMRESLGDGWMDEWTDDISEDLIQEGNFGEGGLISTWALWLTIPHLFPCFQFPFLSFGFWGWGKWCGWITSLYLLAWREGGSGIWKWQEFVFTRYHTQNRLTTAKSHDGFSAGKFQLFYNLIIIFAFFLLIFDTMWIPSFLPIETQNGNWIN